VALETPQTHLRLKEIVAAAGLCPVPADILLAAVAGVHLLSAQMERLPGQLALVALGPRLLFLAAASLMLAVAVAELQVMLRHTQWHQAVVAVAEIAAARVG
jgi:hypothetical protein